MSDFNIYKVMLNSIVQPICDIRFAELASIANELKGYGPGTAGYAIGEMTFRAINYIEMTLALAVDAGKEGAGDTLAELRTGRD